MRPVAGPRGIAPTFVESLFVASLSVASMFVTGCSSSPTAPESTADPAAAQIVTSDLVHFWAAYDAGGKNGSTQAFQTTYLNAASPGLVDFIAKRALTAASLTQMVAAYPRYFAAIRASNLALANDATMVSRIRANYAAIKALYPPATFPPVTFLVGRFSTGGTTARSGLLIGSEFYSLTGTTPLDELQQFQRDNVKNVDSLPIIVAHEHAHALQVQAGGIANHANKTLLEQALMEGGADFIGERSSGGNINGRLWAVAVPMESSLWEEFKTAMNGTDISRWLYNQGTSTATPTRPGDLGYFMGYRIIEAYYQRQTDKAAALKAIIEMKDATDFLARSGYAPVPPQSP